MLRDPDCLDAFLYDIFAGAPLPISVKTRIGSYWVDANGRYVPGK